MDTPTTWVKMISNEPWLLTLLCSLSLTFVLYDSKDPISSCTFVSCNLFWSLHIWVVKLLLIFWLYHIYILDQPLFHLIFVILNSYLKNDCAAGSILYSLLFKSNVPFVFFFTLLIQHSLFIFYSQSIS